MKRAASTLFVAAVVCPLLGGCGGVEPTPDASVYYRTPVVPIQISLDPAGPQVRVSINGELQTPIGTFGISGSVGAEKPQLLEVNAGQTHQVYRLQPDTHYVVPLPTDLNGRAVVRYEGKSIIVDVPNPTTETVASLRERLRGRDSMPPQGDRPITNSTAASSYEPNSHPALKELFCTECGSKQNADATYCTNCGHRL